MPVFTTTSTTTTRRTTLLNKTFSAAWFKKYKRYPFYVEAEEYVAAETLFVAVKKAHSIDLPDVQKALSGLSFDSIDGQVTMRAADHQLLRPSSLSEVVKQLGTGWGDLGWKISSAPASQTTPSASSACAISGKASGATTAVGRDIPFQPRAPHQKRILAP